MLKLGEPGELFEQLKMEFNELELTPGSYKLSVSLWTLSTKWPKVCHTCITVGRLIQISTWTGTGVL